MKQEVEYWDAMARHGADASVIDPHDRSGFKNAYITAGRRQALLEALGPGAGVVLDLGCGTGALLGDLARAGFRPVGVDISLELLRLARRREPAPPVLRYDGERIPLADASVDAACTYVVLNHVLEDAPLRRLLADLARVLRPGGRVVAIEQIRRASRYEPALHTHRRSPEHWRALFEGAGFVVAEARTVRFGHFPLIYAVRYRLLPRRWHAAVAALERWLGRVHPHPWFDYADVRFVLEKPGRAA